MPIRRCIILILFALALLVSLSCDLAIFEAPPTPIPGLVNTIAVQTISANLTMEALAYTPTPIPPRPTDTAIPTSTLAPSSTPIATSTPLGLLTRIPTTPVIPCYAAEFIKDVTIPDGAYLPPNAVFTKVWRVSNTGSCAWTTDTRLIFVAGDEMQGAPVNLPSNVAPGQTADIAVDLISPPRSGSYVGQWMLYTGDQAFGLGKNSAGTLSVVIRVEKQLPIVEDDGSLNFANNICAASWEANSGSLPCPGQVDAPSGWAIRLSTPNLETRRENEPAIWTHPMAGWIQGTFPAFKVHEGDHFMADIGCLNGYPRCRVTFRLGYKVKNKENTKLLGEWYEVYDEEITRVDVDLSSLAEKNVQLILYVTAKSATKQAAAFWLNPQVIPAE